MSSIGRYEIISELGRGGMGTVYKGYDPRFERDVAIKVMAAEFLHQPNFRTRFEREAKSIAGLEHPAIVPVYDVGEEEGIPFLVMRFMHGGTLTDRIYQQRRIPAAQAVAIISRIAQGLDAAHAKGIIHRDVKPDNILFDDQESAYLTDFGLVKLTEDVDSITGRMVVGTPSYMSPEQVHGDEDVSGRSDIYALGVVLFEMMTGAVPYDDRSPTRIMMKHVLDPVPNAQDLFTELPSGYAAIIAKAMSKDPQDRFANGQDFITALESLEAAQQQSGGKTRDVFDIIGLDIDSLTGSHSVPAVSIPTLEGQAAHPSPVSLSSSFTLSGHGDAVRDVIWSPVWDAVASVSTDGRFAVWQAKTGESAHVTQHTDGLYSLAWSADGTLLAYGGRDGTIAMWDAQAARDHISMQAEGGVRSLTFSPDRSRLVSGLNSGKLVVWDVGTGEQIGKLEGHKRWISCSRWSPDGSQLASGAADRKIMVWDASTGQHLQTLEGHTFRVNSVAWSPDSRQLVSGSYDGSLMVWDTQSWSPLGRLEGHVDSVHGVAWSPAGTLLASAGHDNTVVIWDAGTGEQLARLEGHTDAVRAVAWSPDSTQLVSGSDDSSVIIWTLAT